MAGLVTALPTKSAEADFGEGPVTVYWREKASLAELDAMEQAQRRGNIALIIETLFQRARNEGGLRMFSTPADRQKIENRLDPDEVRRVVDLILTREPAEGN